MQQSKNKAFTVRPPAVMPEEQTFEAAVIRMAFGAHSKDLTETEYNDWNLISTHLSELDPLLAADDCLTVISAVPNDNPRYGALWDIFHQSIDRIPQEDTGDALGILQQVLAMAHKLPPTSDITARDPNSMSADAYDTAMLHYQKLLHQFATTNASSALLSVTQVLCNPARRESTLDPSLWRDLGNYLYETIQHKPRTDLQQILERSSLAASENELRQLAQWLKQRDPEKNPEALPELRMLRSVTGVDGFALEPVEGMPLPPQKRPTWDGTIAPGPSLSVKPAEPTPPSPPPLR